MLSAILKRNKSILNKLIKENLEDFWVYRVSFEFTEFSFQVRHNKFACGKSCEIEKLQGIGKLDQGNVK